MLKLLKDKPKIQVPIPSPEMEIIEVGISLLSETIPHFAPQPPKECPICGNYEFEENKKLIALLNPRFKSEFSYLMFVWVHPKCFDDCIETSEPEPVLW